MNTPVWTPKHPEATQMTAFMQVVAHRYQLHLPTYHALHTWSVTHPALFWQTLADFFNVPFITPAHTILSDYQHMIDAQWFLGATFNYTEALLSQTITPHPLPPDKPALISLSESGTRQVISYAELKTKVAQCAQGLKKLGVESGDRVAALLPNNAYAIIAFLATASIGAIWSSCSPDFGVGAITDRLGQIQPKVLFSSITHHYSGKLFQDMDKALAVQAHLPSLKTLILCPQSEDRDTKAFSKAHHHTHLWDDFLQPSDGWAPLALPFAHPLYILFSSGTTGKPKCIVHSAGGVYLQHLKELALHSDLCADDNLFFYTTCGWMMWNWMVSALALGTTLTLYDGAPTSPTADGLFAIAEHERVTVLGTSAKYLSSMGKLNAFLLKQRDLSALRCILSTGSPLLPKHYDVVYECIKPEVQLASISGGTDIVSCFALANPIQPVYRGELQCLGLGMAVAIYNEQGQPVQNEQGELVCTKPFPSMPLSFWQDDDRKAYRHAYFERFKDVWAHGDYAQLTPHHGLIIYGRSDTVLNPGGVRIGTAEIYRQVEKIPEIVDSVVVGQSWQEDVRIVLFVQLSPGATLDEALKSRIRQIIRNEASPRHVPAKILQVPDIPRTINGKVVELAVKQVVHGQAVQNINSLANPEALEAFKEREELEH